LTVFPDNYSEVSIYITKINKHFYRDEGDERDERDKVFETIKVLSYFNPNSLHLDIFCSYPPVSLSSLLN
jgi:hypothetical protein